MHRLYLILFCFVISASLEAKELKGDTDGIVIYQAKQFIDVENPQTCITYVVVQNGVIADKACALPALQEWLKKTDGKVNRDHASKIVSPGFIDPHMHPMLGAFVFPGYFITPIEWQFPDSKGDYATTPKEFMARLKSIVTAESEKPDPIFVYGYHDMWHGDMNRAKLNTLSKDKPIYIWHRSFHEIITNDAGLRLINLHEDQAPDFSHPHANIKDGHFFETGAMIAVQRLGAILLSPERLQRGLLKVRGMMHAGGITTFADMGLGMITPPPVEWAMVKKVFDRSDTPMRSYYVPLVFSLWGDKQDPALAVENANLHRTQLVGKKMKLMKRVKLLADGAFISQLMKISPPGYLDGHQGEWLMEPDKLAAAGQALWEAGYDIHIHVNGDAGLDSVLKSVSEWKKRYPNPEQTITLEHLGYLRPDQFTQIKALNLQASVQPWYVYLLGDAYSKHGLGPERARMISPVGGLIDAGVPYALHSDMTMAPAWPLLLMWSATTRETLSGTTLNKDLRITNQQALYGVTLGAAKVLGLQNEIGSIDVGKKADFTILCENPLTVPPSTLKHMRPTGTILQGKYFPTAYKCPQK